MTNAAAMHPAPPSVPHPAPQSAMHPAPPATPAHAVPLTAGLPPLRVVDPAVVEAMCLRDPQAHHARPILERLGCTARPDAGQWVLPANRLRDLEATLLGRNPHLRPGILAELKRAGRAIPTTVEAVDLALIKALGLDVPAVLLLAIARDVSEPLSVDGVQVVAPDGSMEAWLMPTRVGSATSPAGTPDGMRVPADGRVRRLAVSTLGLGGGVHWDNGTLHLPAMPDTLVDDMAGRPLREIVSHPALDRFGLVVEDAESVPLAPASLAALGIGTDEAVPRLHTGHTPCHVPLMRALDPWRDPPTGAP